MITSVVVVVGLALLAQPKADPGPSPHVLHLSMEIDDLDREIQRLHDSVLLRRGQLAGTQRLSQRGLVSRTDLERDTADLRYQEAHEEESIAYRALKTHERDVLARAVPADEVKAYTLLLDWLKTQEAIAQVDRDFRAFTRKQTRALFQRKAVAKQEIDAAELAFNTAEANIALSRSRQAKVLLELAARRGAKPVDPSEYERLKLDYLKAQIRYYEVTVEGARNRLEIAVERSKRGLIPSQELAIFQQAATDAEATLAEERKKLDEPPPRPVAAPAPRPG